MNNSEQGKSKEEIIDDILEGYESHRVMTDADYYEDLWDKGSISQAMEDYVKAVSPPPQPLGIDTGAEEDFDKELLMMTSWIDKIGVDNTAITRWAAKIKIGSALKRMLEYNQSTPVTGESEAIGERTFTLDEILLYGARCAVKGRDINPVAYFKEHFNVDITKGDNL